MRETKGRNAAKVEEAATYAAEHKVDLRTIELDVLSQQPVDAANARIIADNGRIDVVVHNAGHISLEPMDDSTWLLSMLAIDPERQTAGLGRTLMSEAEKYVRARGGIAVQITVIQLRDSLIAWYERRGYRRTGEIEPFSYGDDSVGVPLRDDLHFVVLEKKL